MRAMKGYFCVNEGRIWAFSKEIIQEASVGDKGEENSPFGY